MKKLFETAYVQIQSGLSQYMTYLRDSESLATPLAQPMNTSTHGLKIGDAKEKYWHLKLINSVSIR